MPRYNSNFLPGIAVGALFIGVMLMGRSGPEKDPENAGNPISAGLSYVGTQVEEAVEDAVNNVINGAKQGVQNAVDDTVNNARESLTDAVTRLTEENGGKNSSGNPGKTDGFLLQWPTSSQDVHYFPVNTPSPVPTPPPEVRVRILRPNISNPRSTRTGG